MHRFWSPFAVGALLVLVAVAGLRAGPVAAGVLLFPSVICLLPPVRRRLVTLGSARWLYLAPGLLLLPDLLFGSPGLPRCAIATLGQLLVGSSLLFTVPFASPFARITRSRGLLAALGLIALLWCAFALRSTEFGGDERLGQDTAYFTQVVDRAGRGEMPRSDMVTALLYDPPPRSHYGAHVSPAIHPLGWIMQWRRDWTTLGFLRSVGFYTVFFYLAWWIARRRAQAPWALLAFFPMLVPVFWHQPLHTVYLLPLAALPAAMLWIGAREGRRVEWILGFVGLALVREDALLFATVGSACVALLSRRDRRWALGGAAMGLAWYLLCTRYVMPSQAPAAGQAVAVLFEDVGGPLGFLRHPDALFGRLFSREALLGTWTQVRATGGLAFLHPLSWAALPAQGVNLLAGGKGFGTLDPVYHYAVLPSTAFALGAIAALLSRARDTGVNLPRIGTVPWRVVMALWIAGAAQSALDGIERERWAALLPDAHDEWLRETADALPLEWGVAAPRAQLPILSPRERLYMVHRIDDYPRIDVDAWLVTEDTESLPLRDGTADAYARQLTRLRSGEIAAKPVARSGPWILYVANSHAWPPGSQP